MGDAKFRKFLLGLSRDVHDHDIEELTFLYEESIPRAKLEKVKKGLDLFKILLEMGIICEGNLDGLIEDLKTINRNDLVRRCEVYTRMSNPGMHRSVSEQKLPSVQRHGQVNMSKSNVPQVAKVLPRSNSTPNQDNSGEAVDDRETPLKTVIGAPGLAQQYPHEQITNHQTLTHQPIPNQPTMNHESRVSTSMRANPADASSVDAGTKSIGFSSGDVVVDGPTDTSFGPGSSFALESPSFQPSVLSLHTDRSLEHRFAEMRVEGWVQEQRAEAAIELIDREGVSSVRSDNSIEFLSGVDSNSSSGQMTSNMRSSTSRSNQPSQQHGGGARHEPMETSAAANPGQPNPLAAGINSILDRVSQSISPLPVNAANEGHQYELFPVNQRPQAVDEQASRWMREGARPRVQQNTPMAQNHTGPEHQRTSPVRRGQPTVSFSPNHESRERESRARERATDGRPDQNRISSTREASYNPRNANSTSRSHSNGARHRQESPSPPPRHRLHQRTVGKQLRGYQVELAQSGLAGSNCIICAPTGSGKTMTAGHICKERRKLNRRRYKTLFIVCIRNLVNQQALALKELFPEDDNVVKAFGEEDILKECIRQHDVVVVTAQILVNSLKDTGRDKVEMNEIDLLILDECHHANLDHPYNNIMRVLLLEKQRNPYARLPQVIGLTASLGVGSNRDRPIDHYIMMCANLNCHCIEYVRDEMNKRELLHHNPKPSQDQIKAVPPREDAGFSATIRRMIREIERRTRFFGNSSSPAAGTQEYNAWIVKEQKTAEAVGGDEHARNVVDSCEALNVLSTALEYYTDLRAMDVFDEYLNKHFDSTTLADEALDHKQWIFDLYDENYEALKVGAESEGINDQPKLGALQELLVELFTRNHEAEPKAILLSRTIFSTVVLTKFVQESNELERVGVKADRLVGKGKKKDCMTDEQQEKVLRDFREDRINLLIATDVAQEGLDMPKCNLLIRYNFVSNEIGSVQAKGRARHKQSECYLIINQGSREERRELENLQREHKMQEALREIDQVVGLQDQIEAKKQELLARYQAAVARKQQAGHVVNAFDVIIVCRKCKADLGRGSDMVKKGSQYIITSPAFPQRIDFRRYAQSRTFRYDAQVGVCRCRGVTCQADLGQKMKYNQGTRLEGYTLTIKSIMFQILNHDDRHDPNSYVSFKKWSVVPFHSQIPEESLTD